jgi:hypothetical protein
MTIPAVFDRDNNGFIDWTEGRIVIEGGIDTATNLPLPMPLIATPGNYVLGPLSTLMANLVEREIGHFALVIVQIAFLRRLSALVSPLRFRLAGHRDHFTRGGRPRRKMTAARAPNLSPFHDGRPTVGVLQSERSNHDGRQT